MELFCLSISKFAKRLYRSNLFWRLGIGVVVFGLVAAGFSHAFDQAAQHQAALAAALPITPTPWPTPAQKGQVLAEQLDRSDQYQWLQQQNINWDTLCLQQAKLDLHTYKDQPKAFDRYVASLWNCVYPPVQTPSKAG